MEGEEIEEEEGVLNLREKGIDQINEIINNFDQFEEVLKVNRNYINNFNIKNSLI